MTGRKHVIDFCLKLTVCVFKPVITVYPVQIKHVFIFNNLFFSALQPPVQQKKLFHQKIQDVVFILFGCSDLPQRYRIGQFRRKHLLVEVQPDSNDGVFNYFPLQTVFYENTGNFPVFPVNIVGPFDPDIIRKLIQGIFYGQ